MNVRCALAAVVVSALAAYPAAASVLSASGQTVRVRPADRADYLEVTRVQDDLNASMREMADESAPAAPLSSPAPSVGVDGGGFIVAKEEMAGGGGGIGGGLDIGNAGNIASPGTIGREDGRLSVRGGGEISRGNQGGNRRDGRGRHGGGTQAAPEPSTWMLLGAGLGLFGGYALILRRQGATL